ncbi:MAG: tetratricopeptide repeat protein [Candidatus Paracaedibacter sp.]
MNKLWFVLMIIFSAASLDAMDEDRTEDEVRQIYRKNISNHINRQDETCRVLQKHIRQHMSWQQDMYKIGLKYRDEKVVGYPKERFDTHALAGWHFLPLAWAGNVKAQHNFAWIKFKQGDLYAACRWYEKAANQGFESSAKNLQRVREEMANKCIWRIPNEALLRITSCLGNNDLLNFRASAKPPAEFVEVTFKDRSQVQTPLVCLSEHPHPKTISYFLRNNLFSIWKISIEDILRKSKSFLQCADFCKIYNYKGEQVFRYLESINSKSLPSWEELDQELEGKLLIDYKSHDMDDQELALVAYTYKIKRFPDDKEIIDCIIKLAKKIIDNSGKAIALPCILGWAKFFQETTGLTHPTFKRLSQFAADNDSVTGQALLSRVLFNEKKVEDAKTYAKKAADQGHTEMQVFLGGIFLKEGNFKDAKYYLEKAVQSRDCLKNQAVVGWNWRECLGAAFHNLSLIAFEKGEQDKAREYDQQGADLGDPRCQFNFADFLEKDGNIDDAIHYLRVSAQQGFQPAVDVLPAIIVAKSNRTAGAG